MKFIVGVTTFLAGLAATALATPVIDNNGDGSIRTFQPSSNEEMARGRDWFLTQQARSNSTSVTTNQYAMVKCPDDRFVPTADFETAITTLKKWCDNGGTVGRWARVGVDYGQARVGICSTGGPQPCSSDEIDRVYGDMAARCPVPQDKNGQRKLATWYEPDWAKTYVLGDCRDNSMCGYPDMCRSH